MDTLQDLSALTSEDLDILQIKPLHRRKLLTPSRFFAFVLLSVDGCVVDTPNDVWTGAVASNEQDFGFCEVLLGVHAVIMGSRAWAYARGLAVWPFVNKRVVVLSSSTPIVQDGNAPPRGVSFAQSLREARHQLSSHGGITNILVWGGVTTLSRFISEGGTLTEFIVTQMPRFLGSQGRPCFTADISRKPSSLELISTQLLSGGLVQNRYRMLNVRTK